MRGFIVKKATTESRKLLESNFPVFPSFIETIKDLNLENIQYLMELAKLYKDKNGPLLPDREFAVASFFFEPSTRTKFSFSLAAQRINSLVIDFETSKSSLTKGESFYDTLKTFDAQDVDLAVIRSSESHFLSQYKENCPLKIINAGDGENQHPTQALLDFFTLTELYGDISGKTIGIIGDVAHSRVAKSLIDLATYFHVNIALCGPSHFVDSKICEENHVREIKSVDELISQVDFIYCLRVQNERHDKEFSFDSQSYVQEYGLTLERLKKNQKKNQPFIILHPGPVNVGIELSENIVSSSNNNDVVKYLPHEQVKHSLPLRMALLHAVLNGDKNNSRTL
jgi:aspartate carbamoyltransferase catalytic subunit